VEGKAQKAAPKIFLKDCLINWNSDNTNIHNLIRGLSPNPCARSFFTKDSGAISFKIYESRPEDDNHSFEPGEILSDGKHFIKIACRKGFLNILSIQLEGKKRMNTLEFLRGFKISEYKIVPNQQV
jgi:methionyl-tRNA formyltransferase